MKTTFFLLLSSLALLVGCAKKPELSPVPPEQTKLSVIAPENATAQTLTNKTLTSPTIGTALEDPWFANLRSEASKRDLDWSVFCAAEYGNEGSDLYMAYAIPSGGSNAMYIEDGGTAWWKAGGATQKEAAMALYRAILRPPNRYPEHKPHRVQTEKAKKQCLPPVGRNELQSHCATCGDSK